MACTAQGGGSKVTSVALQSDLPQLSVEIEIYLTVSVCCCQGSFFLSCCKILKGEESETNHTVNPV